MKHVLMRVLFLFSFTVLFNSAISRSQILESVPRKTCIEIFTGTWCAPCHFAEKDFNDNILPNIDNYTIIEYHQGPDFFATWEGHNRSGYYGLNYVPAFIYDGYVDSLAYIPSLQKLLFNYEKESYLKIRILNAYYDEFQQVYVTGVIIPMRNYTGNDYNLRVVVTEKSNSQHGTFLNTTYYNIQNKMSPNEMGTSLGLLKEGFPIYFNQVIPINVSKIESMDNLRVVILVQNEGNRQIEQSEWQDVTTSNGLDFPFYGEPQMKLFPNPVRNILTIENIKSINNIKVFDVKGKHCNLPITFTDNSVTLNTTSLTDGLYFIYINNRKTFKFVKYEQ